MSVEQNAAAGGNPLVITYGERQFDFTKLPQPTLVAMLRRGVSHYLGSEQASAVQTKMEKAIAEAGTDGDAEKAKARATQLAEMSTADRKAAFKAFRDANPELVAKWHAETQAEAIADMEAGKVGTSVRGPSVDPLTTVVNRLGKAEVVNVLKANKTAIPKKAEDVIEFPNGDKFTVAQLVERRKLHAEHGPRLVKEAKAVITAQERAAKKAEGVGLADL